MFRRSFFISLIFLFLFPRFAFSLPGNQLPFLTSFDGSWFPPSPNWVSSGSQVSSISDMEKVLSTVTKPINYCAVCNYAFWFKVRAILTEDNPQRRAYWYDGVKMVRASFVGGKCVFYHQFYGGNVPNPVFSGVADILQKSIDSMQDNGDRTILYAEVRAGSLSSSYWWHNNHCDEPFQLPSDNSCPNFHIRSLPVVRVRVRC